MKDNHVAALACLYVGFDTVMNALGDQTLFSPGLEWLWWPVAFVWGVWAIYFVATD